jgi:RHS repeat-associated protein
LAEYAAGAAPSAPQKEYGYRGGQLLVIAEPGSGGNLAWGKATSQSSTSFGGESSRGVDGNTSGNWGDNSVSHTNIEHQPWWQVDLGSVQQIGTVRLWNRTDCCSDRLSNFYVLVSDNPFSSTDLTTTINQAGVSSYYTAGPAGLLTEIGVGRSARYVRVQLAGDNYLSLAELEVMGGTTSGEGVKWLVQDHLGSTRMVVDRSGSLGGIRRHDFLPFGEEMSAGVGIRSAALGYGADSTRQKFTGKERDAETGLDFFEARYLSSTQGRFTSPDEFAGGPDELFIFADAASANPTFYADLTNPQSLNKYQYTYNNPLSYTDSDGHCPECPVYYVMSKIQQVDRKITQIKTDLVDYGKGLGKSVANAAIDTVNIGNVSIDDAGRLNYNYDRYEPSNQVQAMAMNSGNKLTLLSTLLGGRVPVNVAMAEGEGAAVVAGEAAAYDATAGNIGRMKAGKPPIGKDGSAIELHHTNQDPNGALIEMTPTEHRGPGNYAKNHPNGNTQPSKIDRAKFAKERKEYWKKKAQDLENKTQ